MLSCYLPFGCLALCTNLKCLDIDSHPYCVERGRGLHQLQEDVGTALDGEHIQFVQETTPPQLVEFRYTANHKFPWGQYIYDEPSALEDTTDLFLIGAKRPDGRPLVDLSRLKKVSIRGTGLEGAPTLKRALEEARQVEEIQLNTGKHSWHELVHYTHIFSAAIFCHAWSLLDTIRLGLTTLKILRFEVDVNVYRPTSREGGPLRELLEESNLLSMTENVIEAMHFSFMEGRSGAWQRMGRA